MILVTCCSAIKMNFTSNGSCNIDSCLAVVDCLVVDWDNRMKDRHELKRESRIFLMGETSNLPFDGKTRVGGN